MLRAVLVLSVLVAGVARGDLLGDVQKQTATNVSSRAGAKLRDAQARVATLEARPARAGSARQARAESKAVAASVTSAARALDDAARHAAGEDQRRLRLAASAVRALAAQIKGDHKKVLAGCPAEVLQAFPAARRYVGLSKLALGDKAGAYQTLKEASLALRDVPGQLALGQLAEARKDWDTAQAAYGTAFAADPSSVEAAMGLVHALFALGHGEEARGELTMLGADPANREANYLLAVLADQAGDHRRAELLLGQVVRAASGQPAPDPAYTRVGKPLFVYPLAALWSALPVDRVDEQAAVVRLAWYQLERGDHGSALAMLRNARTPEALYVRALAARHAGDLAAAHVDLQRAADGDAQRPEPRCGLGVVILEQGDVPTAQETLELNGDDPASMVAEAVALSRLGKAEQADAQLARLVTQKGAVGDAAATDLAALRRASGQADAAWRVLPERPLTPSGWMLRGLLALERKNPRVAVSALKSAIDGAPNYVDAHLALARANEQLGDARAAIAEATRALEITPTLIEAMAVRARLYAKLGDKANEAAELARIRDHSRSTVR